MGVLPARPYRPRDKAKVEAGVRFAQSYILGRLRHQTFFSLEECNRAIAAVLERLNTRPMRRLGVSRRELFEQVERPAMLALPASRYEYAEWKRARVGLDYHIEVDGAAYSVPHPLVRCEVEIRIAGQTLEVFYRGKRVAAHVRRAAGERPGTDLAHMPESHRRYAEWSAERFQSEARALGPSVEALILAILARRPHPEQGFRSCLGVLRLFRGPHRERAEAVCARALEIGAFTGRSIASILDPHLDRKPAPRAGDDTPLLHANIRGPRYFH